MATRQYGTFKGVFTPTLLTILGVIMYLRLGWVVGNAGLLGAFAIISLAFAITAATGLSLSSIATNTRLEAGGAYAIIKSALGLEVGGSIGAPLYLSQTLAVAMYIFGFRDGWLWFFPDHPALLVDLGCFAVIFLIAYISADVAFRIQYVILAIIVASVISVVAGASQWETIAAFEWIGSFPGEVSAGAEAAEGGGSEGGFWVVFAVFFPAATGIMAGANMSGELESPRRAIPYGTLGAIGLSYVIYMGLAVYMALSADPERLVSNYTQMLDEALSGELVLAGLLGATFSSGLASLVGAPRILHALASDRIAPGSEWLEQLADNGEPRRAMLVTGGLALAALLLRDLNLIAPLITMFFMITYAMLNIVLLIEESLGLMSFRPLLRAPRVVALFGALGCVVAMFVINPVFSLLSVAIVIVIYAWVRRVVPVEAPQAGGAQRVRSSIFEALAEYAANQVAVEESINLRAWKPNLLVPVTEESSLRGDFKLLRDVCAPEGSIKLLGLATEEDSAHQLAPKIRELGQGLRDEHVFTTWSVIDSADFHTGVVTGIQALHSAFFRPNLLVLRAHGDPDAVRDELFRDVILELDRLDIGLMMLAVHPEAGTGREQIINLWLRAPADDDFDVAEVLGQGHMDLGILMALRLARAWDGTINLLTVVDDEARAEAAQRYLEEAAELCRFPHDRSQATVVVGEFFEGLERAPQADLSILGMNDKAESSLVHLIVERTDSSCMFVIDSGHESALA